MTKTRSIRRRVCQWFGRTASTPSVRRDLHAALECDRRPRRWTVDALEPRRLLASFNATNGDDLIEIRTFFQFARVIINGTVNQTTDTGIIINALGGNDRIDVYDTLDGSTITVRGGDGDDFLQNFGRNLDATFDGDFRFEGGAGIDLIAADNFNGAESERFFLITGSSITRRGTSSNPDVLFLRYTGVEQVDYGDNNQPNIFLFDDLHGTGFDVRLRIFANGGDDTIHNTVSISPSFQPDLGRAIAVAGLHLDGGDGNDSFQLNDRDGTAASTYLINANSVDVSRSTANPGPVTFTGFEEMGVLMTDHGNTVTMSAKASAMDVDLVGGEGSDSFTVGGGDLDSNGFNNADLTHIGGGAGVDTIRFDDRLDREGEVETYVLTGQVFQGDQLRKGTAGINYDSFETQILDAADAVTTQAIDNVIHFQSNGNSFTTLAQTVVDGGANRRCLVTIGDGFLSRTPGSYAINLGAAKGSVTVNDSGNTASTLYQTVAAGMVLPKSISYGNANSFNISAGTSNNGFQIDAVPAGTAVSITAKSGDDHAIFGNGNVSANILSPVVFNGGGGTNFATIHNRFDPERAVQTYSGSTFTDGQSLTFFSIQPLVVQEGPGGTDLTINSASLDIAVTGGSGDDHYIIGGGDLDSNFLPTAAQTLGVTGGSGGFDSIRFNDLNDVSAGSYTFQRTATADQLVKHSGVNDYFFQWSDGIDQVIFDASNAPSPPQDPVVIRVLDTATPLRINANAGSDRVEIADATVPVTLHTGSGDVDQLIVNSDFASGDSPVTVLIDQNDDVDLLDIRPGGVLRVTQGATLVKTRQSTPAGVLNIEGVLDLAGGSFLSRAGGPTAAAFRNLVTAGFNGGAWNGTSASGAINSSLAATTPIGDGGGYGLGAEIATSSIGGISIAAGDILLRHALYGDANLDGSVGFADLLRVAQNYNLNNRVWSQGDFNSDGLIGFADLLSLAQNYGASTLAGRSRQDPDDDSVRADVLL